MLSFFYDTLPPTNGPTKGTSPSPPSCSCSPTSCSSQRGSERSLSSSEFEDDISYNFGVEPVEDLSDSEDDTKEAPVWNPVWGNLCKYHAVGTCTKGSRNCPFSHDEESFRCDLFMGIPRRDVIKVYTALLGTAKGRLGFVVEMLLKKGGDVDQSIQALKKQLVDRDGNCVFWAKGWCRDGRKCMFPHDWVSKWGPMPHLKPVSDARVSDILSSMGVSKEPTEAEELVNGRLSSHYKDFCDAHPDWKESWMTFLIGSSPMPRLEDSISNSGFLTEARIRGIAPGAPSRLKPKGWHETAECSCHKDPKCPQELVHFTNNSWHQAQEEMRGFLCRVCHPGTVSFNKKRAEWKTCSPESALPVFLVTV